MKQKFTLQGKSLLFNVLFVVLNLTGLTCVVVGSHASFENYFLLLNFIGYLLIALSSAGIFIFSGRLLMANVSRVLVGALFIVSGLVKANDPIGFSYKLEEYFEDGALAYRIKEWFGAPGFSLEFLIEWALVISVVICIVEIVLGVLLLIGGKIKLVAYLMVGMLVFFTFLTWHTANCDNTKKFVDRDTYMLSDPIAAMKIESAKDSKDIRILSKTADKLVVEELKQPQCVDDCGCFGDAMKGSVGRSLTPKESLWKDIVLLYLVVWIFIAQWLIVPNTKKENLVFLVSSLVVTFFFSWVFGWYFPILFALVALIGALWIRKIGGVFLGNYFGSSLFVSGISAILVAYILSYEPLKDYRPYAIGSNLVEKMNDGIAGKYESVLVYVNKKTGEKKSFLSSSTAYTSSKIWEDKNWEYLEMTQKEIVAARIPSITDQFNPFLAANDLTAPELKLDFVKKTVQNASIKGLVMKDIVNNFTFNIAMSEFNTETYMPVSYAVLDTINMQDPSFTEISLKEYLVTVDRVIVLSAKNLVKANWTKVKRYKSIFAESQKRGIPFVLITNANRMQINAFRKKHQFNVPVFLNDETELKAIARSNPSLLIFEKGTVKGKYPHRSTPTFEWLNKHVFTK